MSSVLDAGRLRIWRQEGKSTHGSRLPYKTAKDSYHIPKDAMNVLFVTVAKYSKGEGEYEASQYNILN